MGCFAAFPDNDGFLARFEKKKKNLFSNEMLSKVWLWSIMWQKMRGQMLKSMQLPNNREIQNKTELRGLCYKWSVASSNNHSNFKVVFIYLMRLETSSWGSWQVLTLWSVTITTEQLTLYTAKPIMRVMTSTFYIKWHVLLLVFSHLYTLDQSGQLCVVGNYSWFTYDFLFRLKVKEKVVK